MKKTMSVCCLFLIGLLCLGGEKFQGKVLSLPDLGLEMIRIEPGTFIMGSPAPKKNRFGQLAGGEKGRFDNEVQHKVTISKSFWIGKFEVTQEQWKAVMGDNPSKFIGDNRPVENVSWYEAMKFCQKLNEVYRNELPDGYEFSLPTEAQWEYACRAGTTGAYAGNLDEMAWYKENSGRETHDVGQKKPNACGLYDMHGNVWEWCYDWSGKYSGDAVDPVGSLNGTYRVFRGGSWDFNAVFCRSAFRSCSSKPDNCIIDLGFRLALRPLLELEKQKIEREKREAAERKKYFKTLKNDLKSLKVCSLPLNEKLRLPMQRIEPGTFTMGSPDDEKGRNKDEIQHKVTISKPFWIGRYEVTQAQWKTVMGNNPSEFKGDNRPVERVSWFDAMKFCRKLNEAYKNELPKGYAFSLPTEAQWEYACRAGTTGAYAGNLNDMAWYTKNSGRETYDVGQKKPNAWGLYDMHGNVLEWCYDWFGEYSSSSVKDPVGPISGAGRVFRGGSWGYSAELCRSASRGWDKPDDSYISIGFRLALRPVQ